MAIAVVTGGGSGIGRACCRLLARKGWRVMVLDINEANAKAVAAEIGGNAYGVDVSDETTVAALAKRIEAEEGPIEGLVNCAGLLPAPVAPDDLPMSEWDRITRVNQRGTYLCCVIFGRQMAARRRGGECKDFCVYELYAFSDGGVVWQAIPIQSSLNCSMSS